VRSRKSHRDPHHALLPASPIFEYHPATVKATELRSILRLGRWLGPWADADRSPDRVSRRRAWISAEKDFEAFVYRTRAEPTRAMLLLPGLHFLGPAHPQLDRLARIMAHAGYLVMAPKLRAFMELRVSRSLLSDAEASLRALIRLADYPLRERPDLMSVSFGSAAAIHLAGSDEFAHQIGRTLIFGGFADWNDTLRFSVAGRGALPHDPLNRAVVYRNLLPHFDVPSAYHQALSDGWLRFCKRTWGQPTMKERPAYESIATELAEGVHPGARDLFLEGCSCDADPEAAVRRCDAALGRSGDTFAWLDPRPKLGAVCSQTYLVHGRDDDVIPYTEAERLGAAFPDDGRIEVLITGLYSHTRQDEARAGSSGKWRELKTLTRIVRILAGAR